MGRKDRYIVIQRQLDADYQRILSEQNEDQTCPHCSSTSGHFATCPLICRETAEAQSTLTEYSETDVIILHALGVRA